MLSSFSLDHILFLDVETVPEEASYHQLSEQKQVLWTKKAQFLKKESTDDTPFSLYHRAGIYAEFGKIICISVGYMRNQQLRIKSFYGDDEAHILSQFKELCQTNFNRTKYVLCAHNGKEFDFPYIARRMLVHRIKLPIVLQLFGKKPWEVKHLDTMDMWRFGDYKNYTSLELLAHVLGIPTPKDDIQGSDVARVYWEEKDIKRIVRYCEKDVFTVVQVLLAYMGEPLLEDSQVQIVVE